MKNYQKQKEGRTTFCLKNRNFEALHLMQWKSEQIVEICELVS